jgi:hypothetical protein
LKTKADLSKDEQEAVYNNFEAKLNLFQKVVKQDDLYLTQQTKESIKNLIEWGKKYVQLTVHHQ